MLFLYNYLALIGNSQPQKMLDTVEPIRYKSHVSVPDQKF